MGIFWRLISFQNSWKMFKLLSFFISYVLRGNTVFVKTFLWSEFYMFTWLICCHSGLQWMSYVAFPICLFEPNWRNSHTFFPHSYLIFPVADLTFPIPCQINPKCREPFFENFVKIAFDGYFTSSIKKDIPRLELKCDFENYTWFRVVFKCKQNMTGADHKTQR